MPRHGGDLFRRSAMFCETSQGGLPQAVRLAPRRETSKLRSPFDQPS